MIISFFDSIELVVDIVQNDELNVEKSPLRSEPIAMLRRLTLLSPAHSSQFFPYHIDLSISKQKTSAGGTEFRVPNCFFFRASLILAYTPSL